MQDYLYVEAEKEAHVRDAIRGLRTVFASKGVKLVPLPEMTAAITVNRKEKRDIGERGTWARCHRTGTWPYRRDLLLNLIARDCVGRCHLPHLSPLNLINRLHVMYCCLPTYAILAPFSSWGLGARASWPVQG